MCAICTDERFKQQKSNAKNAWRRKDDEPQKQNYPFRRKNEIMSVLISAVYITVLLSYCGIPVSINGAAVSLDPGGRSTVGYLPVANTTAGSKVSTNSTEKNSSKSKTGAAYAHPSTPAFQLRNASTDDLLASDNVFNMTDPEIFIRTSTAPSGGIGDPFSLTSAGDMTDFSSLMTKNRTTDFSILYTTPSIGNSTDVKLTETFLHGFVASLTIVLVSELGDKTFFIAAIMAMRNARTTVFFGALSALFIMTALSAGLGYAVKFIPRIYTFYISTALFAIFGIKMLIEGIRMKREAGADELEEVQQHIERRDEERAPLIAGLTSSTSAEKTGALHGSLSSSSGGHKSVAVTIKDTGSPPVKKKAPIKTTPYQLHPFRNFFKVFIQAFTMTFLAEWGDRSQISTVALAATENLWGITVGGTLGHATCTGIAVIGGRLIAQRISVKAVTIVGALVFLGFAISSLIIGP